MTPKGGIQPHSRFGVNSKKAEVLFVDYIIEHLKPSGRAGIIVPEGIVFKPYSAYKKLRKKLLDNALVGVISLPPGVFYPYAGVKTSILILDKSLNKKNNNIFFANVNNDGFSLSQQRIKISENDLPKIKELIKKQKSDESLNFISKAQILSEKDLSLQINRYVEVEKLKTTHQVVPITDTFDVITPPKKIKSKEFLKSGKYPIIDQSSKKVSGFWFCGMVVN